MPAEAPIQSSKRRYMPWLIEQHRGLEAHQLA